MDQSESAAESDNIGEIYSYHKVSLWYRLAFAGPITLIAAAISVAGLHEHYERGTLLPFGFLWLVLAAIGGWISRAICIKDVRREFATVATEVPASWRRNRTLLATAIFAVFLGALLFSQPFAEVPMIVTQYCILPAVAAYLCAVWAIARHRMTTHHTKAAIIEMRQIRTNQAPAKPSKAEAWLEHVAAIWWVRYLFGLCLLIGAVMFAAEATGRNGIMGALALGLWGTYCMREVFGWLLGAVVFGGIFYAVAGAVAAIPVSLAIIIGAIIIANSRN